MAHFFLCDSIFEFNRKLARVLSKRLPFTSTICGEHLGGERNSAEIRSILILCNAMLQINTFLMQSRSNCFPKADFIWETRCKFCNTWCKFERISARKYITAKFGAFCVFSSFINSNSQIMILKFYHECLDILDVFVIRLKKYIQIYNPLHCANEMCLCVWIDKFQQYLWLHTNWVRIGRGGKVDKGMDYLPISLYKWTVHQKMTN